MEQNLITDNNNFVKKPDSQDVLTALKELRIKNLHRVIVATLNVNSISGKFDQLKTLVTGNIDILVITESKLDASFPDAQFIIDGYSEPYRLDRNRQGGGVLIYIREDIPSKKLTRHVFPNDIEGLFIEINLRKCKWLLMGSYHPPSQTDQYYFDSVAKALDIYSDYYEKFLLVGDFNAEETEPCLSTFLYEYEAKNLVKNKTCYKNPENPSCVDLFLTNSRNSFQNTTVISTGLSDCHKMPVTVLKMTFDKAKPKKMMYRDYKNFEEHKFKEELNNALSECITYKEFENNFVRVLQNNAPLKKKYVRANHAPYMTKALRKAMMKRSELETRYYKTRLISDKIFYKKQKNFVSRLYKKERKAYYKNLDLKNLVDNKNFWKNIKPFFSDKGPRTKKITLVKNGVILSEDQEVSEALNSFFNDAVKSLSIKENVDLLTPTSDLNDPIDIAIKKFEFHPSILKIKEKVRPISFSFNEVDLSDVEKELQNLNIKKVTTFNNIPSKHLKQSSDICSPILLNIINHNIASSSFPEELKLADVTPIFKKDDATCAKNYRPVSVLPAASKVYERLIYKQIAQYFEEHLSPYLCGYRKKFNTQHALVALIERWKTTLDNHGYTGALLMDLSKAFDTLNHDLLLAKLYAYGFSKNAIALVRSYLTNRWQRTKINTSFSSWTELLLGVPQGSVLGPLLFNIYINDLFWINEETDVCNYADDTTFYACDQSLNSLLLRVEHDALLAIEWFECNYMKLNKDKCHLLVSGHKHECIWAKVGQDKIWESAHEKLLGVTIDKNLTFDYHISNICAKAGKKLTALSRISRLMPFEKRKLLMRSFIGSQFTYAPLTWMFHDRRSSNKINRLHERALRIVYKDDTLSFEELLEKDESVTIHVRNLQSLAIELYKVKNDLSPILMKNVFLKKPQERPNLRSQADFFSPQISSVHYGQDSLKYLGPKLWNNIPEDIKSSPTLEIFKTNIKKWKPDCPCRLCKSYIQGVGYVTIFE